MSRMGHLLHLKDIFKDKGNLLYHHLSLGNEPGSPFFNRDVGCRTNLAEFTSAQLKQILEHRCFGRFKAQAERLNSFTKVMQLKWHKEAVQWDRLKKGGDFLCRICERRIYARLERTHTASCQELATVNESLASIDKKFVSLSETVSKQIVAKNLHEQRKFVK